MITITHEKMDELEARKSAYPMDIGRILDRDYYYALLDLAKKGLEAERRTKQKMTLIAETVGADMSVEYSCFEDVYHSKGLLTRAEADAQLTAARADIAKLRQALEPFAEQASLWPAHRHDDEAPTCAYPFTLGDFRRAAVALAETGREER